ncbi:MAG: dienelactone hydrolase family protein [Ignavibacterium album]|uniref:dienelactone hydrolase family protein n=1 Tax=Ignavibacterium album TaxID=591197 RepID=UPI0026EBF81D|nr:dienelactone hydrolase family protein [Ignavibacterium album]MCX8104867.1 dienelactone hydrolase family protein [Ignavibacterium album]
MFRILILFSLIFTASINFAQEKSCCQMNVSFTSFSEDKNFRDAHQLPNDFVLSEAKGKMIKFKTVDGKEANAYYVESPKKSKKFIFVFHEWWGLNDNIKREADELQEKLGNVNVLALDLYDGQVATKREDAAKLMQSNDKNRSIEIIKGAINFAGKDAEIGTIGWCFGGGWSLQASILLGKQGKACVIYYGIIENTPETFKNLNAPVLGIFAEKDGWITPEVYGNLEKNLKAAGKKVTIKSFNADHAFANPSNTNFDEKATKEAKELTLKFFKENLMK